MDHISPEALAKIKQLAVGGDETNIVTVLAGQRFIITARGRMGYGPGQLDEGDDIFVPFGARAPIVLRKCERGFMYLGEAHVSGLMDSKTIHEHEAGDLDKCWVDIC